jgi:hypothetical protein
VISAEPSGGIVASGSALKSQSASFTVTWLTVTDSGPPLVTLTTMSSGVGSDTRSMVRSSTGGRSSRSIPAPFSTMAASSTPNPSSGASPRSTQTGPRSRPISYSFTSKRPIQPSSANSLTWAWNMKSPGKS